MRSLSLFVLAACTGPVHPQVQQAPSRPTAKTREGRVVGQLDQDGVQSFRGVPYAAPPVGGDRWREALPPLPHPPLEATAFRFTHAPNVMGGKEGAFHGSELVYLFPSVFVPRGLVYTEDDRALAKLMSGYWARFAATGDPNGDGALAWPRYSPATDQHMTIDVVPSIGSQLRRAECDVWDQVDE